MSASSASTSSMVWVNTGYGLTFAALALLAGYKLVSYRNTMHAYRQATTKKPKINAETFIALLDELRKGTETVIENIENAVALPSSSSSSSTASSAAVAEEEEDEENESKLDPETESLLSITRAQVQRDIQTLEKRIFNTYKVTEDDVQQALLYYTKGSGATPNPSPKGSSSNASSKIFSNNSNKQSELIQQKVIALKKVSGKYMVTKRRMVEVMGGTFQIQANKLTEIVEKAIEGGVIRSPQDLQMFMNRPHIAGALQTEVERYSLEETGLSVQDIDAITREPEYSNDPVFVDQMTKVATEGQQLLQEAQQRIMMMLGGGGGGPMGMMG